MLLSTQLYTWLTTISMVHLLPSSCLTAAMAATQGVYNNVNIKKTNAVKGVNKVDIAGIST